jgi:hypothetical protein
MREFVFFLFLLSASLFMQSAYGQQSDPVTSKEILLKDSLHTDSIRKETVRKDTLSVKHGRVLPVSKKPAAPKDSAAKKKHDPRRATLYSTIFPGAGQIYNRKYWKLPIVYAAIGIPVYAFFYNKSWYQKCQYALAVTIHQSQGDSLKKVDPALRPFVSNNDQNGIITYRDSFRKDQDYSVLFFLLFYGLNIVDATVDAHLRDFNVNSDLSFKVKPMLIAGPNMVAGFSLVFDIHKGRPKPLNRN